MKHLINFQLFNERIDIKDSDSVDVRLAKDKLNSTEDQLNQYPNLKSKIDSIYKSNKDKPASDIYNQVLDFLGKDPKLRNPFAVSYLEVAKLEMEVKKLTDSILVDESSIKLSTQNLSLATSNDVKKKMQIDLDRMKNNISEKKKKLEDTLKKLNTSRDKVNQEIAKTKKEIIDSSKKISESDKK